MCKKLACLLLLTFVLVGSAQAQFISAVAHRNTDSDAPEEPRISPDPMAEDALVFVDRTHQYNEIPEYLIGAQYVMTANDNKNMSAYELDLVMSANATVYVFVDNRMGSAAGGLGVDPDITGMGWLNDLGFVDTGDDIGIDESGDGDIDQYSSVFAKAVKAGETVTIRGNTEGHGGNMLSVAAQGPRLQAYNPVPEDGTVHAETWVSTAWTPGDNAVSHDVYLSDNFDDVNDGTGDAFRGNQAGNSLIAGFVGFPYPDGLANGVTYYWRIDEVEADGTTRRGNVWSFTVPPKTAYAPDPADGAEFVDPGATLSWTPGFGAKLHTVYIGDSFEDVNNATGGSPRGTATFAPATSLEPEKVYYWRVDEFDPPFTHKGDIWSFTTPGAVGNPQPANGAVDVQIITKLGWTPADNAAASDLYFGADADAVKNATAASPEFVGNKARGSESYDPGKLAMNATYYWRADAVYPDKTVKGLLWSFTAADFLLVDDFESYNDIDPPDPNSNRIFDKWIDGFGTTTNGALVGNDLPPYAELNDVHGGDQAMPYAFDNNLKTSEATLTLVWPRDFTEGGMTKLSLWFKGDSGNAAERMFVALNGNAVVYHDDPAATQINRWTEWVIDLQAFAGVALTNVNTITIGFGTKSSPAAGGTGTLLIDDIRLIP